MSDVNSLPGLNSADVSQMAAAFGLDEATAKIVSEFIASFLPPAEDGEEGAGSRPPDLTPPNGGALGLEQLFAGINAELRRQTCREGLESIDIKGKEQEEQNIKQMEELAKQLDAMRDKSFWNGFLKAFRIIGMIAGAIASAATAVIGGMTGQPALIAIGIVGMAMIGESILSSITDGEYSLSSLFTGLGKMLGMDEATAKKFALGMQIAVSVLMVGACVGAGISCATSKISESFTAAMNNVFRAQLAGSFVQGFATAGQGAVSIEIALLEKDAADARVAQKRIEAILERIRDFIDMAQELLEQEVKRTSELVEDVSDIVKRMNEARLAIQTVAPPMA